MGREVRMVPAEWQHPKNKAGHYVPLYGHGFADRAAEWDAGKAKWDEGFVRSYDGASEWRTRDSTVASETFEEWDGPRPQESDYMPDWPADERTHFMMYEDTSEGTPISPVFPTAEELARWLADNGASSFGSSTASYDQWLAMIRRGSAISMVISGGVMRSGVEFGA